METKSSKSAHRIGGRAGRDKDPAHMNKWEGRQKYPGTRHKWEGGEKDPAHIA